MMKRSLILIAVAIGGTLIGCDKTQLQPRVVRSMLEQRRDKVIVQAWDISCGAAALATLLTYDEGDSVTEREVAAGLLKSTSIEQVRAQLGFSLLDLKHYSEGRGFKASGLGNVTFRDLVDIGPAILPVVLRGFNHFVVYRGMQGDRVLLADPAWGNRSMLISEFLDIWQSRVAFTIERRDQPQTRHPLMASAHDFWASSATYEEPGMRVAALVPDPEPATAVASADTPSPLSQVAAGFAERTPQTHRPAPPREAAPEVVRKVTRASLAVSPRRAEPTVLRGGLSGAEILDRPGPSPVGDQPAPVEAKPDVGSGVTPTLGNAETTRQSEGGDPAAPGASVPRSEAMHRMADWMMKRGAEMLALGDLSAARRLYGAAAAGGSGAAATAVGKTFDPDYLSPVREIGIVPDIAAAAIWYQRAAVLGDAEGLALFVRIKVRDGSRQMASDRQQER